MDDAFDEAYQNDMSTVQEIFDEELPDELHQGVKYFKNLTYRCTNKLWTHLWKMKKWRL